MSALGAFEKSILIVEDDQWVRSLLAELLSDEGYRVLEAACGDEGLRLVAEQSPDVVVLDLNLEGAGGLEVLRRILSADNNARVVVFSMHHEPIYAVRALRGGARGYVSKSAPVETRRFQTS